MDMKTGTVKWFSNVKGYGFLESESTGEAEIFVHFSAVEMDGYRKLSSGQAVQFELVEGDKGPSASNVMIVDS